MTIPVRASGHSRAPISTIEIADPIWTQRHLSHLQQSYSRSRHFGWLHPYLVDLYRRAAAMRRLTDINELLLRGLLGLIELPTRLTRSEEVPRMAATANGRLIEICRARGASVYITGPAAKAYIDPRQFAEAGIALFYANYAGYPRYDQGTGSVRQSCEPGRHAVPVRTRDAPPSQIAAGSLLVSRCGVIPRQATKSTARASLGRWGPPGASFLPRHRPRREPHRSRLRHACR